VLHSVVFNNRGPLNASPRRSTTDHAQLYIAFLKHVIKYNHPINQ